MIQTDGEIYHVLGLEESILCGTSQVVQWIRLHAPNAGGPGSIPGEGTRSHMHAATKSLHATTKEPACRNKGAHLPQLRSKHAATKEPAYCN